MKKYICVDDYINLNGAYPVNTNTTLKQVCDELKWMPEADVIPVDWLREWFDTAEKVTFTELLFAWSDYKSKEAQ